MVNNYKKRKFKYWIASNTLKAAIGVLIISFVCSSDTFAQTWVYQESFTGNPSPSVSGNIITTESENKEVTYTSNVSTQDAVIDGGYAGILNSGTVGVDYLEMGTNANTTAGNLAWVTGQSSKFGSSYKTVLNQNTGVITWYGGVYYNRGASMMSATLVPANFCAVIVLVCDKANPREAGAKGYGLFLLRAASNTRCIVLRYFDNGIEGVGTVSTGTNVGYYITKSNNVADAANTYFRTKTTYNPTTNTWALTVSTSNSFGTDPTAISYGTATTGVNNAGTAIDMPYFSFAAGYTATQSAYAARFDNFHVSVEGTQPVKLTSFTAQKALSGIKLNWQTASEQGNSHFEVLRSADGVNFSSIGRVEGNGTTSEVKNFNYTDNSPLAGTAYYQLKQVDFNGNSELSNIVFANTEFTEKNLKTYVSEDGNVMIDYISKKGAPATVEILDISGKKLAFTEIHLQKGDNLIRVPTLLGNGAYVAILKTGGEQEAVKFLK